ncbi:hypothetical protein QTP70_008050 [Hemibagrus guttatus]|uniref:ribonuclease H n=1 Tax=Hemibagrus guttatus TaxID=175788 RepID=A0AAE0R7K9_9TELE|nr:hypothetical protein QTP70_008050 [Hemibagrus guttatus]
MASSSSILCEDQLQCPICLDVFTDPVSTPCGHNFCMICLKEFWDSSSHCQCPVCKTSFPKRPELCVNTFISALAAQFKKTVQVKSHSTGNQLPFKPLKKVQCDSCTEKKLEALKSCLHCGVSYCNTHLMSHKTTAKLMKHKLIDPVENLEDYICQKHERPLELFCRDDQTCVCQFCTETDHKTHNTVPLEEESGDKKIQLGKTEAEVQQMIQERLKKIEEIKDSVKLNKKTKEKEKADVVDIFCALIHCIERSQAELLKVMEEKQKAAERQAEEFIKDLEQEITELKRRNTELEQLSHTEDHLHLLQIYPSLCRPPHTQDWTDVTINTHLSVETLRRALSQLQESLREEMEKLDQTVDVTLDPDTAHPELILSDDMREVKHRDTAQSLPDNPERFDEDINVLGKEGFSTGRFYYEVMVRQNTEWDLGVVRESINRKGDLAYSPESGYWSVWRRNETEYALDSPPVRLFLNQSPQKVGVYVDYAEGLISFYDVDAKSHIYSFTGQNFTETLYPLFSPCLNDGGKGRELADMMERRKGSKRNGVGVVLKEEFVRNVLEVKRVSDRVMSLKLEIEGVMLNVVSGYAPQVGCELEEKERFWSELDEVMESIPTGERVVIGADFNGHVGEGNTGDEEVMGKFGVKERNLEGQMVVDFAKRMDMGVVNTYFQKREEHRVTNKSGGRRTQVDYILCRRGNLKEISDCKVVVGESVARQHRMVVCRMTLMVCKKNRSKIEIEKKTKWWKLKKEECCEEFRQKLRQALGGQVVLPDDWETTAEVIRETGRKVLVVSSGWRKEDKETWWWNEEVQDSIQRKRLAKKKWDMDRTEENRQEYKELQRRVKREVSKAKQKAYDELYTRLDTREGEKDLYRLARQRDRDGKDVQQVRVIKDRDGRVLTSEESVQRRWKEYFEELMNEENEREKRLEGVNSVEQKVDKIRKDEVRKALKRMKSGKAVGPDNIPVEVWKCLGEAAVEFLTSLFNRVLESERMPEEWRLSVLVLIFKNKGDVQSCSNYRGIKLMSHTMKLWERVVEARLRKVVEIFEQQYGFMPRKSTTDAIFALRILMQKYRDGQRELHCVFVDLEKAYDRVPREELWYCMRKSGVAEKYVRVVQDMYERSRTVVRCSVGQTEEFKVEVGLHQGSALSPFLFAIVLDQLSEEVRQESPWTMMFTDDIVICSESREQVEENL